jgi:hypothetical protein
MVRKSPDRCSMYCERRIGIAARFQNPSIRQGFRGTTIRPVRRWVSISNANEP